MWLRMLHCRVPAATRPRALQPGARTRREARPRRVRLSCGPSGPLVVPATSEQATPSATELHPRLTRRPLSTSLCSHSDAAAMTRGLVTGGRVGLAHRLDPIARPDGRGVAAGPRP
jgi:hypothetical protein